jgi:hypothetical protein
MTKTTSEELARRTFRAGGAYELIVFDRLPPEEQAPLAELGADADFYGILKPRAESGRTIKVVGKDTALLWLTLQAPGPLPFFVWSGEPETAARAVTELVLDGVLEIAEGERFVSGPAAAELLLPRAGAAPRGRLAELSLAALRYGEGLRLDEPQRLAARLYGFGRAPVSPAWARRLSGREAVLAFLGAAPETPLRRKLEEGWQTAADGEDAAGWITWSPRQPGRGRGAAGKSAYKLYVSPAVAALPAAFAVLVDYLAERAAVAFKVGTDAAGLLRPDKLVVYFDALEELLEAASELGRRLAGLAPHGVPFSAEVAGDGLLSWGMDPPAGDRILAWQERASWRLWVVRRLAAALVAAQADAEPGMAAAQFALERLRREGVDVDRWTPSAALWQAA